MGNLREYADFVLGLPCNASLKQQCLRRFGEATVGLEIVCAVAENARKGDVASAVFLRDTAGQSPETRLESVDGDFMDGKLSIAKFLRDLENGDGDEGQ